jgi:membrane protein required for beta-lactamase induction
MVKGDRSPDRVSEAFRRVSRDVRARDEAGTPTAQRIDWVVVAFAVLVVALIGLGILNLFEGWVLPG